MAEEVGNTGGSLREGLRDGVGSLRDQASREKVESRLDEAVNERPLVRYLLDLRIVVRAVLIAAVVCLVTWLVLSPKIAAILLVLGFVAAWLILATREYNERRPTQPADPE